MSAAPSYGIGNHCLFVIDFAASDVIGISRQKVVRPTSRRLNTEIPKVEAEYARILEEKVLAHRLFEQMGTAHRKSKSKASAIKHLNKLDKELGQYMRYAERKCRKIKSGRIPFSPEASLWMRRMQVYQSLLKYHAGRIKNRGNLKRAARRCQIMETPCPYPSRKSSPPQGMCRSVQPRLQEEWHALPVQAPVLPTADRQGK